MDIGKVTAVHECYDEDKGSKAAGAFTLESEATIGAAQKPFAWPHSSPANTVNADASTNAKHYVRPTVSKVINNLVPVTSENYERYDRKAIVRYVLSLFGRDLS